MGIVFFPGKKQAEPEIWVCLGWFSGNLVPWFSFEEQDKAFICVSVLFFVFFFWCYAAFLRVRHFNLQMRNKFQTKAQNFPVFQFRCQSQGK